MTEHEQLAYLWKIINQLHTAAQDVKLEHLDIVGLPNYVLRRTNEAMQVVPYPGEPPEDIWEDDTRPHDYPKD